MDHRPRSQRLAIFVFVATLLGVSFFVRHIAGIYYTQFQYSCLVYNPRSVRESPPAPYDFLPDDVSWDETRAYARWTNEVLRGEWGGATLGSFAPFLTTEVPRHPLWLRDRLGIFVLAIMARASGGGVRTAFLAADLLFPFGAALSIMLLAWEIRPSISFAVSTACLVMVFNWQDFLNLIHFLRGAVQNESIFLRTPYPQFSTILLCFFLVSLVRTVRTPDLRHTLMFIAALDLNLLTYFYSWTYALAFAGSALLVLAMEIVRPSSQLKIAPRDQCKLAARYVFTGMLVGLGVAFPVWRSIVQKSEITIDTFLRVGGAFVRTPEIRYSGIAMTCFVILLLWKSCAWENRWLAMTYLLASAVVLNIQTLTGSTIQPGHWTGYYIQPVFILFALDCFWSLSRCREDRMWCTLAIVLLAAAVLTNIYKFSAGARHSVEYNRRDSSLEQVLEVMHQPWLSDVGFLSNDDYLSVVLPAYLQQKPLLPWYMDPQSDRELRLLQRAAREALDMEGGLANSGSEALAGSGKPLIPAAAALKLRPDKIVFVLNRHRPFAESLLSNRRVLLRNDDFIVLAPIVSQ